MPRRRTGMRARWLVALWGPRLLGAQPPNPFPHAAEELPPLTQYATIATTTSRQEATKLIDKKVYESAVRHVAQCPCGPVFGKGGYYVFDTAGQIPSGLNHQQSNLKAMLTEGLSLGRAVLLRKPTLTRDHNFHRAFKYNMWGDFIAFNTSTFTLTFAPRATRPALGPRKKVCSAKLADCVADASESQLAALMEAPHAVIPYHNGSVPEHLNDRAALLVRGPVPSSLPDGEPDKVALVRKLPGFPGTMGRYQLRLDLKAPEHIAQAVPPILNWLTEQSSTGKTAVVHVRRGDKIQNRKYCPNEMRQATSPENIARVLERVGVPTGSSVYVMSDETDFNHFRPLLEWGYKIATNLHFDHLHALLEGCSYLGQQRGLPCENYLLFAIEKEIIEAVPPASRIVTLPRHDLVHNKMYLMNDFLGPGKPCRALR